MRGDWIMAKQALILASHGEFAKAARETMEMIIGHQQENIGTVLVTEGKVYEDALEEIKALYETLDTTEGCMILTDIYGGTPANVATYLAIEHMDNIRVFSGLNVPLLLEVVLDQTSSLTEMEEKIESIHKDTLVNITKKLKGMNENGNQVDTY